MAAPISAMFSDSQFDQDLLTFLKYSFSEEFDNAQSSAKRRNGSSSDDCCRKRAKLAKSRHSLPDHVAHSYANNFAAAINSHNSELMRELLTSLGDMDDLRVITRFFTEKPKFTNPPGPDASCTFARTDSPAGNDSTSVSCDNADPNFPSLYGRYPFKEYTSVDSYLCHLEEIFEASPDAVFKVLSVSSFQTYEAVVIMIGYSYTTTVLEKTAFANTIAKHIASCTSNATLSLSSSSLGESPLIAFGTTPAPSVIEAEARVRGDMESIDEDENTELSCIALPDRICEGSTVSSLSLDEEQGTDSPISFPFIRGHADSSGMDISLEDVQDNGVVTLQPVHIRGSLALYLSNSQGKLYRVEFFSQVLPSAGGLSQASKQH